ncbi:MAG TPA: inositol monophosphatase family protein [Candidatus Saccharimonadales bacterium]|nr:inositol monophosphatase family protein [Candidatus Saccharimonadales bacterium]
MSDLDEYLEFAKDLAAEAGRIMKHYYQLEEKGVQTKKDQSPVTLADTEINSLVIKRVAAKYPSHGVLGEEENFNLTSKHLWVVDPVDGTQDFIDKIPNFNFSLAQVVEGELAVGVVYNPIAERMFYASAGSGAYENGQRLQLSNAPPEIIEIDAWLAGGIENSVWRDPATAVRANRLLNSDERVGKQTDLPVAYALAQVASGDFDAFLSTIKTPWDVAAGSLIASEAGARITDLFGAVVPRWDKDVSGILAASPEVHQYLLSLLAPALKDSR